MNQKNSPIPTESDLARSGRMADADTEGHVYIPKDERSTPDTDGHGLRRSLAEADSAINTEGHGRRTPQARADGSEELASTAHRLARGGRIDDAGSADTTGHGFRRRPKDVDPTDTEGHGLRRP